MTEIGKWIIDDRVKWMLRRSAVRPSIEKINYARWGHMKLRNQCVYYNYWVGIWWIEILNKVFVSTWYLNAFLLNHTHTFPLACNLRIAGISVTIGQFKMINELYWQTHWKIYSFGITAIWRRWTTIDLLSRKYRTETKSRNKLLLRGTVVRPPNDFIFGNLLFNKRLRVQLWLIAKLAFVV